MKLVRQSKLQVQEGKSDKIYEVDLCEAGEGEFLVNFRYGRRGTNLREGTKTPFPEPLAKAEEIFTKLVNGKIAKGYAVVDEGGAPAREEAPVDPTRATASGRTTDPRQLAILARLKRELDYAKSNCPWRRSRLFWRAGELRLSEAAPLLLPFCELATSPMEALSLAWAVGRTAGPEALPSLERLATEHPERPEVKRMVAEAKAAVVDEAAREQLGRNIVAELPEHLRKAIESGEAKAIEGAILTLLKPGEADGEIASQLYLVALSHPPLREALFHALKTLPTGKGYFHFLRRVFKAAEFRLDAEFFGMMARRWDSDRDSGGARWVWDGRRAIRQPAPAFSKATKMYLRRRVVRTLNRAGEAGDATSFITLATGVLLSFDEERDAGEVICESTYEWNQQSRNYTRGTIVFPRFASCHSFMWLLHRHSPRHQFGKGLRWRLRSGVAESAEAATREEAFPELWDQAPDAIMHLLRFARAEVVHEFAVRVWRANPRFNPEADIPFIRDALKCRFGVTRTLGLDLARERWDPSNPDPELLLALLECPDDEARSLGIEWLKPCAAKVFGILSFLSSLALNPFPDVQSCAQELLRSAQISEDHRKALVTRTIAGLLTLDPEEEDHPARASHAASFLWLAAPDELANIDLGPVSDLAAHPLEGVQLFAAQILLRHRIAANQLPDDLLLAPLSSPFGTVRTLGIDLLGKLDDAALARRGDVLANCAISEHAELRQSVAPLLDRLSRTDPEFARDLTERLYPVLLRKESYEGLHDDLLSTLTGPLAAHLDVIPAAYFPRMLDSKYKAAQGLGFVILLKHCDLSQVALAQLVTWANHELHILREHLREHFAANPQRLIDDLGTASKLPESDWSDTRDWAFSFFTDTVPEESWTPETLITICDSVQPEVQQFARTLITKRFREEDGPLYLLRLSEHPTHEMQVFATNYLARFATDEADRIRQLEPYFRALFGRINAGRIAKNRIFAFLLEEAMKDASIAELAIELLAHYAATVSTRDKSACLESLLALKQKWPDLANPLRVQAPALHSPDAA